VQIKIQKKKMLRQFAKRMLVQFDSDAVFDRTIYCCAAGGLMGLIGSSINVTKNERGCNVCNWLDNTCYITRGTGAGGLFGMIFGMTHPIPLIFGSIGVGATAASCYRFKKNVQ